MKILFVEDKQKYGGVTNHLVILINGLLKKGYECSLGLFNREIYSCEFLKNINTYIIDFSKPETIRRDFERVLKENDFDLIHLHTSIYNTDILESVINNSIKTIMTRHSVFYESDFSFEEYSYIFAHYNRFCKQGKIIIAVSKEVQESLISLGAMKDNIVIINNGVQDYQSERKCKSKNIIFVGRLSEEKRIEHIILAAKILKEKKIPAKIDIYGEGRENTNLENLAKKEQVEDICTFRGFQNNVSNKIGNYSILLSTSRTEACPYSVLEAMSSKVLVIASDICAHRDILDNGRCGMIYSSVEELAEKIECGLLNSEKVIEILNSSYSKFRQKYTIDNFIEKHCLLYKGFEDNSEN